MENNLESTIMKNVDTWKFSSRIRKGNFLLYGMAIDVARGLEKYFEKEHPSKQDKKMDLSDNFKEAIDEFSRIYLSKKLALYGTGEEAAKAANMSYGYLRQLRTQLNIRKKDIQLQKLQKYNKQIKAGPNKLNVKKPQSLQLTDDQDNTSETAINALEKATTVIESYQTLFTPALNKLIQKHKNALALQLFSATEKFYVDSNTVYAKNQNIKINFKDSYMDMSYSDAKITFKDDLIKRL